MLGQKRKSYDESHKCFQAPLVRILFETQSTSIKVPNIFGKILYNVEEDDRKISKRVLKKRNKWTQTDFRDSETQTVPWEAPYTVKCGLEDNLEVLKLRNLTWGHGLPAGEREVVIIKAMRKRREWEARIPPMNSKSNIRTASAIITALEAEDWVSREKEIRLTIDIRMKLYEKLMQRKSVDSEKRIENRLERLNASLNSRRNKTINMIRHKFNRELRKLSASYKTRKQYDRFMKGGIKLEDYVTPDLCFTTNYQQSQQRLRKDDILDDYINPEPSSLPSAEEITSIKPKPKFDGLCIRHTKWDEDKLKQLYEEMRNIRLNVAISDTGSDTSLFKRKLKSKVSSLYSTPRFENKDYLEREIENSATLLQTMVRGRAVQNRTCEGRDRCQDLIDELKSTHGLHDHSKCLIEREKAHVINLQFEESEKMKRRDRLNEILDSLEGTAASRMLDFLSKELTRLEDERRAHAYVLLATRSRQNREAVEANQREAELRRQEELDKIFRDVTQIDRESVEAFLQEIINDGIKYVTDEEVKTCILDMSDKIDRVASYIAENAEETDEDIISEMCNCISSDERTEEKSLIEQCTERQILCDDVFDLLQTCKNQANEDIEDDGSFTEEHVEFTNRTYTLDENTQTWETYEEETINDINEVNNIICCIVDNILSYIEQNEGDHNMVREILNEILFSTMIKSD